MSGSDNLFVLFSVHTALRRSSAAGRGFSYAITESGSINTTEAFGNQTLPLTPRWQTHSTPVEYLLPSSDPRRNHVLTLLFLEGWTCPAFSSAVSSPVCTALSFASPSAAALPSGISASAAARRFRCLVKRSFFAFSRTLRPSLWLPPPPTLKQRQKTAARLSDVQVRPQPV